MTCREFAEFLLEYFDGSLPPERRRTFEDHLRVCEGCVEYLKGYRMAVDLARQAHGPLDADAAPAPLPEIPEALVQAILAARGRPE